MFNGRQTLMLAVAWDIETCPFPLDDLSPAQKRRYAREVRAYLERHPDADPYDASNLVRSLHPRLGWICCLSAVRGSLDDGPGTPHSWFAEDPEGEADLLRRFWADVARLPRADLVWVTFNGKRFDVPFLESRSSHHGIAPTRTDLVDTHPYRHRPHADLARLWPMAFSLEDLCELLRVDSPKADFDGGQVAAAVDAGRLEEVVRYCERDVLATFACFHRLAPLLSPR